MGMHIFFKINYLLILSKYIMVEIYFLSNHESLHLEPRYSDILEEIRKIQ